MRLEIFDQECPDLGDILTVCPQTRGTHSWFGAGTSWDGRCAWGLLWPGERLGSRCTERTGASSAPGSVHGAAGATSTALSECMCKERAIFWSKYHQYLEAAMHSFLESSLGLHTPDQNDASESV